MKKKDTIKKRLQNLKKAWVCASIEGLSVSVEDKKFIENLIKQGLSDDAMIMKTKEKFFL